LGVLRVWGYLATSDVKSDVVFLFGDPISYKGDENFAFISLIYRDPHFGLFFWGGVSGFGGI